MTDQVSWPALPGEECRVPPHDAWTDLEKWVWHEIGSGRTADINTHLGTIADPRNPDDWSPERRLSARFLETILLHNPWRSVIPRQGVRIKGGLFEDEIDLSQGEVPCQLWLDESRFASKVSMVGLRAGRNVTFDGSTFVKELNMRSANIAGSLFMRRARFVEATFYRSRVQGRIVLSSAEASGTMKMRGVVIGESILMDDVSLNDVDLSYANIHSQIILKSASKVELKTSAGNPPGKKRLRLRFAQVRGNVDLRGARLAILDLSGARLEGELRLASGSARPTCVDGARLVLRNARLGAVQDEPEAWPKSLELDGFTCERFGLGGDVGARGTKWFVEWLARNEPHTPQPYHQCAKLLREMGHPEMANDVVYAGRERERCELWKRAGSVREYGRAFGLWLLKATIGYGYGYRYFRSLWWVGALIFVGAILLGVSAEYLKIPGVIAWSAASWQSALYNVADLIWYSLDLLLPIVSLDDAFEKVNLSVPLRYYFYFEKLMGYVLASFLIAGLAGLTK